MPDKIYSCYHEFPGSALAWEMNLYDKHISYLDTYFHERDVRGALKPYTVSDQAKTEELRIKVIVLAAIYIEALANLYFSLKLSGEQFQAVDRMEITEKWAALPSLIIPAYRLDRSESVYNDLKNLVKWRNSIVHMKPRILYGDQVVQEGNLPKAAHIHQHIKSWDTLPCRLIENLRQFDNTDAFMRFYALSGIEQYSQIRRLPEQEG